MNRYAELYNLAPVGYLTLDKKGYIQEINLTGAALFGIERNRLIGKKFSSFIGKDYSKTFETHLQQCRQANDSVTSEVELLVEGGKFISVKLISRAYQTSVQQNVEYGIVIIDIPKLNKSQEVLPASNKIYRSMVEFAEDLVFVIDKRLCYSYVNKFTTIFLGIKQEEMIGKPLEELFPLHTYKRLRQNLSLVFDSGKSIFVDGDFTINSKQVWLNTRLTPIMDNNGNVKEVLGISRDVTKNKLLAKELSDSEERYKKLSQASFEGIAIHDYGPIIEVNQQFADLFGYTATEVVGMHAVDFAAPESRETVLKQIKSKSENPYELLGLKKDGSIFQIELRGKSIPYQGRMARVTVVQDLTENKKKEKALRESESMYRFLVESINEGLVQIDSKSVITYVNSKMCEMIGYHETDLIGKSGIDLVSGNNKEALQSQVELRKKGIEQSYEFEVIRKDGTKVILLVTPKSLFDEGGNYAGSFSVCKDVTDRKQAEEIIKASLAEKEVLLKEIHHRVKNSLQFIMSLLELHSNYIEDEKAIETYMNCQNRIKTIAYIHEHLYQSDDLAKINLNMYIQNLIIYLLQFYKINPVAIKLKINIDDIFLDIKRAMPCGLIFNELVSNALMYAFPEGRAGDISIGLRKSDDKKYIITVEDNGVGFTKDIEFNNTNSIGLQLVSLLTQQIDGVIECEREYGTKVKITFPES